MSSSRVLKGSPYQDVPVKQRSLLALDGGGVRGLSSLVLLENLMDKVDGNNAPKPCDYFDLVGGTSTGGLIAIMLGRLRMDVPSCIKAYTRLASEVFHEAGLSFNLAKGKVKGKYDSGKLKQAIKRVIVDAGFGEDEPMLDNESSCKVFVITKMATINTTTSLRSYRHPTGDNTSFRNLTIWEAALATSAAPTFFDPVEIGSHSGSLYVDGAMGKNNPIFEVWNEGNALWNLQGPMADLGCIISIGTGVPNTQELTFGPKSMVNALISIATETEESAKCFWSSNPSLADNNKYFRFSVDRGAGEIAMDAVKEIGKIRDSVTAYMEHPGIGQRMVHCAKALQESIAPRMYIL
ncbi:phospholipase, patatin family protein [Bisporella sp. PMI_857]|nr:phospholipase, patatin family protein [Bisporella sp. PMI_857]